MIDARETFNDLGAQAEVGLNLLEQLNVNIEELAIPRRFQQLKTLVEMFRNVPADYQRFVINKATRGKNVDKLQHMYEYMHLLKSKGELETREKMLEQERESSKDSDEVIKQDIANRSLDNKKRIDILNKEIELYEK